MERMSAPRSLIGTLPGTAPAPGDKVNACFQNDLRHVQYRRFHSIGLAM